MARSILISITSFVIFAVCVRGSVGADVGKAIEAGINLGTEAYEAACWYEFLQNYIPRTHSLDFNQCHGQANFQRKVVFKHGLDERLFGQFLIQHAMHHLPREYMKCSRYLLHDRFSKYFLDYSKIFNNGSLSKGVSATKVPYEAFSHCVLSIIQENYGDDALLKISQKLSHEKNWAGTMFDRENEFRALHNSQPLRIHDELTFRAQKWADQLARSCQMYHIHSSHPDYFLNGSRMGENLFTGDSITSPREDMALFGTNIWYEEIIYYPWPEYQGYGSDPFLKFSHFSQMLWKDTKMVGYGFSVNASESCGRYFIVSRYFPPGNFWGQFGENVRPLILNSKEKKTRSFDGTTTLPGSDESFTTDVNNFRKN